MSKDKATSAGADGVSPPQQTAASQGKPSTEKPVAKAKASGGKRTIGSEFAQIRKRLTDLYAHFQAARDEVARLSEELEKVRSAADATKTALQAELDLVKSELLKAKVARESTEARQVSLSEKVNELEKTIETIKQEGTERGAGRSRRPASENRPNRSIFDPSPSTPEKAQAGSEGDRRAAVLADWGFASSKKESAPKKAAPTPAPTRPAPVPAPTKPAPELAPKPRLAASDKAQEAKPSKTKPSPAPAKSRSKRAVPPPANAEGGGPTVLDVIDLDQTITSGQRTTLRDIYTRFAPQVMANPSAEISEGTTIGDVLDKDPNLQYGQREALRTMYNSFGAHRRKT